MGVVLLKSAILLFIIALGFGLKQVGVFHRSDSRVLTAVMIYVTLPGVLINAMRDFELDPSMALFVFLGCATNIILTVAGWALGRRESPKVRAMYMLTLSCFNIGSFAAAFVSSVFPALMLPVIVFDMGNALMNNGTVYSFAAAQLHPEQRFSVRAMLKTLFTTFVFDMYLVILAVSLLHIRLPDAVYELTTTLANANAVAVMLLLGVLFEVKLTREARRQVATIICGRTVCSVLLAALMLLLLPLSFDLKRVAAMMVCTPISGMSTVFCGKLECDPDVYGTAASLSIPVSLVMMTVLSLL